MSIRKRLTQEESRTVALEAARALLIELGPQAVTLKAVASRIGRTHANLLHHFGSARAIERAGLADLEVVPGVSRSLAKKIYDWFHPER